MYTPTFATMDDNDNLVTCSAAARLLKRHRQTVRVALEGMTPDEPGDPARWRLSTVRAALARRAQATADQTRNTGASPTAALTSVALIPSLTRKHSPMLYS